MGKAEDLKKILEIQHCTVVQEYLDEAIEFIDSAYDLVSECLEHVEQVHLSNTKFDSDIKKDILMYVIDCYFKGKAVEKAVNGQSN